MKSFINRDRALIWHPFTQEKTAAPPIAIKRADGVYLYDENDKVYLDLISSWWVNLHGHCNPFIAKSIYEQSQKLEHVIFAGFTHEPAIKLCEDLTTVLPHNLNRFFFSDNGSTATEVALKMAHQYWQNKGETQRKYFLCFDGAYHGDTFGAMSVGKKSGFHDAFNQLLFDILPIPYPNTWIDDEDYAQKENQALEVLKNHLTQYSKHISAIILEPLIQGASGMRMCRPEFVDKIINEVRSHDILVIFDEVMTGFGRTGTVFACEQIKAKPDLICVSKGITGGFLPLAMTVATDEIYQSFLSNHWKHAFAHGHSYTANPLACAAGIASLKLLKHDSTTKAIKNIEAQHKKGISMLRTLFPELVIQPRIRGTISAFEVKSDKIDLNKKMKAEFLQRGLLIRPLDNTVYLLPPYVATTANIQSAYDGIVEVLSTI